MTKPSRKGQTTRKGASTESGERQSQPQAIEATGFTTGLVSLLVPLVLPLAVLAVVLMASLTLPQTDADSGAGGRMGLESRTILEGGSTK